MHDELTQADLVTGGDGTAEAAVRLDSAKTSRETLGDILKVADIVRNEAAKGKEPAGRGRSRARDDADHRDTRQGCTDGITGAVRTGVGPVGDVESSSAGERERGVALGSPEAADLDVPTVQLDDQVQVRNSVARGITIGRIGLDPVQSDVVRDLGPCV